MRTSCIRLRAKSRIAVLYEDYLEILNGNMLAAMLLAILVYWTDIKIGKKDSNLWIWKSHTDFQDDLLFDKEGMKPPHRTTISSALDLLVEKKFVYRRKNPKMPLDQTKQYLVDQTAVQAAIDALPPIVVLPTLESRNSDNAMSNKQQSLSENQQCNAEIPTSNTSDYITEITNSVITEEREGVVANAPTAPAQLSSEDAYHFAGTAQQHLLWNCRTWCAANHGTCEGYVAAIDAGLHESPTDKMPAVPPGNVTPVTYSQSSIPDGYMQGEIPDGLHTNTAEHHNRDVSEHRAHSHQNRGDPGQSHTIPSRTPAEQGAFDGHVAPTQQTVSSLSPGAATARHSGQASDGAAPTAPPRSEPRASGKGRGKAPVGPPLLCDTGEIERRLIERRGWAFEVRKEIIAERVAVKAWCYKHTLEQFDSIMDELQEKDSYWKKPENKWRITGQVLARETPQVLARLERQTKPDELEEYSVPWFLAQQARRQAQELQA